MKRRRNFLVFLAILSACMALGWIARCRFVANLPNRSDAGPAANGLLGKAANLVLPRVQEYLGNGKYFWVCNLFFTIGSILAYLILANWRPLTRLVKSELIRPLEPRRLWAHAQGLPRPRVFVALALCLFLGLFAFYASFGFRLARGAALHQGNFFEFDPDRVIADMTNPGAASNGTGVHPIYRLLLNPAGTLLTRLGLTRDTVAIVMNSALGSLGSVLALLFFWIVSGGSSVSILLTLCFSLSMSQLLLSTFPETGSFAGCTLILTYLLFWISLLRGRIDVRWWVVVSVLTLGVTTANFVQVLLCLGVAACSIQSKDRGSDSWERVLLIVTLALGITAALAMVQKAIYPATQIFFVPSTYIGTLPFFTGAIWGDPFSGLPELAKQLLVTNLVGTNPEVLKAADGALRGLTSFRAWNFSLLGWLSAGLMTLALAGGAVALGSRRSHRAFILGIVLCLLFNLGFHSIYGLGEGGILEWLVYSADFTFLILIFLCGFASRQRPAVVGSFLLLIVMMGVNNVKLLELVVRTCERMNR